MKTRRLFSFLACAASPLFTSAAPAAAGEQQYVCEVVDTYELDGSGVLEHSNWQEQFAGSRFTVSRSTGQIVGQVLPTDRASSVQIINPGSADYSFKAVAHFEELGHVQVIEIQEFKSGRTKPFVAMSMGGAGIVTGVCE